MGHDVATIYIALLTYIIVRSSRPIMHHLPWPWPHNYCATALYRASGRVGGLVSCPGVVVVLALWVLFGLVLICIQIKGSMRNSK